MDGRRWWKLRLLLFLTEFSFLCWSTTGVTSNIYRKVYYQEPADTSLNPPQELTIPNFVSITAAYCGAMCVSDASCIYFKIDGGICHIYGGSIPMVLTEPPVGQSLAEIYMAEENIMQDIALSGTASGVGYLSGYPAPYSTLIDGNLVRNHETECPCTTEHKHPTITIDLLEPREITMIIVTTSFSYKRDRFKGTEILVGNTGSYTTDPVVATKDTSSLSNHSPYEFPVNVVGRYVTLHKSYLSGGTICVCHIQIIGK